MVIRPYVDADHEQLVQLGLEFTQSPAYAWLLGRSSGPAIETIIATVTGMGTLGLLLVAEDDGGLVGFLAGVGVAYPFTGEGYLEEIAWWVTPLARGAARVGPKLHARAEEWARRQGLTMVKMVAPAGADAVAAYYQRRGYRPVETTFCKVL